MEQPNAKWSLRREHSANRPQSSAGLLGQLKSVVEATGAMSIASYQPLESEPDVSEFNSWAESSFAVYYPLVTGENLTFAKTPLVTGSFGIQEPTGPHLELAEIDLILIPALAVDMEGHRVGKGRGFYDRALERIEHENLYAVVFDSELVLQIPHQAHDKKVSGIVTPTRVLRVSAR